METVAESLGSVPLFQGLDPSEQARIAAQQLGPEANTLAEFQKTLGAWHV